MAEGFVAGTELKYQCKPGYTAASGKPSVVTCLRDGTWSADVDFCIREYLSSSLFDSVSDLYMLEMLF